MSNREFGTVHSVALSQFTIPTSQFNSMIARSGWWRKPHPARGLQGGADAFELRFELVQHFGGARQFAGGDEALDPGADLYHSGCSHVAGAAFEHVGRLVHGLGLSPLDRPAQLVQPERHIVDEEGDYPGQFVRFTVALVPAPALQHGEVEAGSLLGGAWVLVARAIGVFLLGVWDPT